MRPVHTRHNLTPKVKDPFLLFVGEGRLMEIHPSNCDFHMSLPRDSGKERKATVGCTSHQIGRVSLFIAGQPAPFQTSYMVDRENKRTNNRTMLSALTNSAATGYQGPVKIELLKGAGLLRKTTYF